MMQVGDVRVLMGERRMLVCMRMRFGNRAVVLMPMVLVMNMQMLMQDGLVPVAMTVFLPKQHRYPRYHEYRAGELQQVGKFAKHHD